MGARVIWVETPGKARAKEARTLALTIALVVIPLVLAFAFSAGYMRKDLGNLTPKQGQAADGTTLIGWPDLEMDNATGWQNEARVRMLGYMMDAYEPSREGAQVRMFVLMPEAGELLHPAHRISDQMIEIWTARPTPFRYRSLVWVSGNLERIAASAAAEHASYAMTEALVEPAQEADITAWFQPREPFRPE